MQTRYFVVDINGNSIDGQEYSYHESKNVIAENRLRGEYYYQMLAIEYRRRLP